MSRTCRRHRLAAPLALLCSVLLVACEQPSRLEQLREDGTLRVITRNTPTTYYQGRHGDTGLEYELSRRFADSLQLELEMITSPTLDDLYQQLVEGKGPH
ncbi:MAG: lytic transglycosylase F, partial [Gammaproteobacteria bacterium]|nr:lytic transglycosylase F [Gammaproteobacteria bacterium]